MNDANLVCLNSGAATRHNRSTGNPSTPDIFLAPTTWTNRLRWQTKEDIGGSDHLPILIQAFCRTQRLAPPARRQRWKPNHNLSEFRATLEHKLQDAKLQVDTLERAKQFTALVIETATATVPRTKLGKKTRCYITSEIKQLISKRNRLRRNLHQNKNEWLETCRDVREKVAAARKNQWVEFIEEVEYGTDPRKLWSILHSLNDSTTPSQPNEALKLGDKTISSSLKKPTPSCNTTPRKAG